MTNTLFSELGISPELLKAVDKMGFEKPSPIQAEAIPVLLQGQDVVGQSETGSGKTAAFGIPAIEKVDAAKKAVQVLVLCPTRELAMQVCEEFYKLAYFKRGIHAIPIYGGQSYERQYYGLRQGAQIVIGTPGRVMDHMRQGTLRLDNIRMMVLDEADVMLNMGFRDDIELILKSVPTERQTVFFSATMPQPIRDLIERFSKTPKSLRIEHKALTVATTEQVYYEVDRRFKVELLTRLIDIHDLKFGIVFCNTKRMVDDLVDQLNAQGYSADRLHGDMTQNMRDRVMNKFRKSELEFLVATDVAARGIDVNDVEVVFNYDLPYDAEDYVHRIGRTGRAGKTGLAISFVGPREMFQIHHIERYANIRITRAKIPTLDEVEEARTNSFLDSIRKVMQGGEFKIQDYMIQQLVDEGYDEREIASALIHLLQNGEGENTPHNNEGENRFEERRENTKRPERAPRRTERVSRPAPKAVDPAKKPTESTVPPVVTQQMFSPAPTVPTLPEKPVVPPSIQPTPTAPAEPRSKSHVKAAKPSLETAIKQESPAPETKHEVPTVPTKSVTKAKVATTPPTPPSVAPVTPKPSQVTAKTASETNIPTSAIPAATPPTKIKASRRTPKDQTRLFINIGQEMGVVANDVVSLIMGETGLPAKTVGTVDIRERHLFVDVTSDSANAIVSKLNRAHLKGRKIKVKTV